jgi:hypothetical protein
LWLLPSAAPEAEKPLLPGNILPGISHMTSGPRPAWAFFVILCLLHRLARTFLASLGFSLAQGAICRQLRLSTRFSMTSEDTASMVSIVFMRVLSLFLHPDAAAGKLSRPIPARMDRNNSLGIATSAIWKTIFPEWRTTFAPILISFSRNVVNVQ